MGMLLGTLRQVWQLPGARFPGRPLIESLAPVRYLTASYYERFLHALEMHAVEQGLVTRDAMIGVAKVAVPRRV